jgi:hypothetical protein
VGGVFKLFYGSLNIHGVWNGNIHLKKIELFFGVKNQIDIWRGNMCVEN